MQEEDDNLVEEAPVAAESQPLPVDRSQWHRPWVQLKFFTFQLAIFPRMLKEASSDARPGDFVSVYDKAGKLCGAGLYNPRAKIPVRVVSHAQVQASESYFEQAVDRSIALRKNFKLDETSEAYRLINSDGDGLSGLIVDRYSDVLFCEVTSLGMFQRLPRLLPLLHAAYATKHSLIRVDHDLGSLEGIKPSLVKEIVASAPQKVRIRENGIRYEVDFVGGHKTGFFCDQRDNRLKFSKLVRDARVLDLCSYTGGFSISAKVAGGASDVTGVDLDEVAIEQAKRNANMNQARIKWVHADAFSYARQMQQNGESWDAVVLDPPKFIFTRELAGAWEGKQKYEDLNQLAISLVKPGGLFVTCSCSGLLSDADFEGHVIKAAHRLNRRLQFFDKTGAGVDHPVYSNCLESRYLKVIWARVV